MECESLIRIAIIRDLEAIQQADFLYDEGKLKEKISRGAIIVCEDNGQVTGVLRYMWFWDYIPFINFIWVEEGFREEHRALRMIQKLIEETEGKNYKRIMASTQSDESAQGFFRMVGFEDAGGFTMKDQPFELIMIKYL